MNTELKKPVQWQKGERIKVIDPDGWRFPIEVEGRKYRPKDWNEPVTYQEYLDRRVCSTVFTV